MRNKLYIKFENLDDFVSTFDTLYQTFYSITLHYSNISKITLRKFLILFTLITISIFQEFGLTEKDILNFYKGGKDEKV